MHRHPISGMATTFMDGDFTAFKSGSNYTVVNNVTQVVTQSGTDAYKVIQGGLNGLGTGQRLHLKPAIYQVASSLSPVAFTSLTGEGGFAEGSQIKASGNIPAVLISNKNVEIRGLIFTHNEATYSGGVLKLAGGANNCYINDTNFYDNGRNTGSAIELNNGGQWAGPISNVIDDAFIFGFQDQMLFNSSGGAAISGNFINGNVIMNIQANSPNNTFAMFRTDQTAHIDGNFFNNINGQAVPNTTAIFDYNTQMSGSSWYNKHIACFLFDLGASAVYANTTNNTGIDMVGCHGDTKISGAGATNGNLTHYSASTDQKGHATVISSGVGTTNWFVQHKLGGLGSQVAATPNYVDVTPANQLTAQSGGTPYVTNTNNSGFTINGNAVNSGSTLSWYWRAVF